MHLWLFQVVHERQEVFTLALSGGRASHVVAKQIPEGATAELNGMGAMSEREKFRFQINDDATSTQEITPRLVNIRRETKVWRLAAGIWASKVAGSHHLLDKESLVEVTKKGGIVIIIDRLC